MLLNIWATFAMIFFSQEHSKIAQSGHTDHIKDLSFYPFKIEKWNIFHLSGFKLTEPKLESI